MEEILSILIKKQEQKIFKIGQHVLLSKKAKCPRCSTKILLNDAGKSDKLCFFCSNCQCMFEKNK